LLHTLSDEEEVARAQRTRIDVEQRDLDGLAASRGPGDHGVAIGVLGDGELAEAIGPAVDDDQILADGEVGDDVAAGTTFEDEAVPALAAE